MTALRAGAVTDVGRVRTNNEDQLLVADSVFAVADGMGGHAAGEVASQLAVETLQDVFTENPTAAGLLEAVRAANANVIQRAQTDVATRGMGTTICAAALVPGENDGSETIVVLNVGDSRAYLLRDGELSQITEDHSVADELMRAGQLSEEEAATDRRRHVLTRVLGMDTTVMPDRFDIDPYRGDRLLLASDGLTNEVPDAEIASILRRIEDPGEAARELVRVAKNNGGADNITVIVVDVTDDDNKAHDASQALAKEPPRPRGLITSAERDEQLRGLAEADGFAEQVEHPGGFEAPTRRLRRLRITAFGLLVLAVIAGAVGAVTYIGRPWYVGVHGHNLAIYRGGNGLFKREFVEDSHVPLTAVDGALRNNVRQWKVHYGSRKEAEAYIHRVQATASTTTSSSSTTSTSFGTPSTLFVPTTTSKP